MKSPKFTSAEAAQIESGLRRGAQAAIKVTFTRTYLEQPLVVLDGGPFNGAERTPEQLRELARGLLTIAGLAERRPCTGRGWRPSVVSYELLGEHA